MVTVPIEIGCYKTLLTEFVTKNGVSRRSYFSYKQVTNADVCQAYLSSFFDKHWQTATMITLEVEPILFAPYDV